MTLISLARATSLAAAALPFLCGAAFAQGLPSIIEGTWLTKLQSEITIAPCDQGYCGRISKIVVPQEYIDKYGAAALADPASYTDQLNEDPAMRNRPIQDLVILTVAAGGNPFRYDGRVYNPQDGKTYDGYLEVIGADTIKLNGCILYGTVCQGEEWTRVVPPPDATAEAPAPDANAVAPVPATRAQ